MKKKILFVCNNLIYGGIPRSLISLLREIKDDYEIDLMLFWQGGEYIDEVPEGIRLVSPEGLLPLLGMPQSVVNRESLPESVLRMGFVGWSLMFSHRIPRRMTFATAHALKGYDIAVSYAQDNSGKNYAIGCNDYVLEKVEAPIKIAFVHCDFLRYGGNDRVTRQQYRRFDRIACVSKSARKALLNVLPELRSKVYVVENCTDYDGIRRLAEETVEPFGADAMTEAASQGAAVPEAASLEATATMGPSDAASQGTADALSSKPGVTALSRSADETSQGTADALSSKPGVTAPSRSADDVSSEPEARRLNMVTVSRLTAEKGHVRAMEALQSVIKRHPGLTWTIIGDGPCMKDIVYTARDKGILDRVFLYGAQKNPYPYMKMADFFFLPSIHEAAPMVFGEALALELPVLTTDTCTAARKLANDNLGIVCANSKEGIEEGLEDICKDPSILERLKASAKKAPKDNSRQKAQFERMLDGVRSPADVMYTGTAAVPTGVASSGSAAVPTGVASSGSAAVPTGGASSGQGALPTGGASSGSTAVPMQRSSVRTAGASRYGKEDRPAGIQYEGLSLSIIVPVYNRSLTVRRCAESLLRQDIKDYEIIFVDDGSDDGTAEVLEEIRLNAGGGTGEGVYPLIKVIHTENGGVARARNIGLAAASGRYVTWVDSDDWIEKNILGRILDKAEKWEADVLLYDGWEVVLGDIHPYSAVEAPFVLGEGRLSRAEYLLTRPCPWNKWIRRDILAHRHDCPDFHFPEGEIYEDLSIIPTLAMRTDRIYYMKEKVYHYYCSGISIMNQDGWNEDMRYIFRAVRRVQRVLARDFPEEVEYIWWRHLLINGSRRFLECGRQDMAEKAARWMKKYYPGWRKNHYVRQSSRGARLSGELLAAKDYAVFRRYCAAADKIKGIAQRHSDGQKG